MHQLIMRLGKLASDNSPAILTTIGVTGVVSTAYLTVDATTKYMRELAEEGYYDRDYKFERSRREHLEKAWKLYVPAVGTGVVTIFCIIAANRIGGRRAAAIATAYTLSEKAFGEYRDKVVERLGANKERVVRDEVAQERITKNPPTEVILTGDGEVLCYESLTGRYFKSNVETLKKAENEINHTLIYDGYASLSEFFNKIGLPDTAISDELGWKNDKLLELMFSTALSNDGKPCLSISYRIEPIRDYYKFG